MQIDIAQLVAKYHAVDGFLEELAKVTGKAAA